MLDSILNELKGELADKLTQVPGLGADKLDDVINIAGQEVTKQVGKQMLSGNISTLMNLFSRKPNDNSANDLQNSLTQGILSQLISKLGLNQSVASSVVNMILPVIIEKITNINSQTPDDDDTPLRKLFGGDSGGAASAIGNLLDGLF